MANLRIPASNSTVQVSVIHTGAMVTVPVSLFLQPEIEGHTHIECVAYSFLINHPQHGKVLFDFGMRKDWENLAPVIADRVKASGWKTDVEEDVVDALEKNGIKAEEIKSVIWSHWHFDHVGDMSRLPSTTELVVGAGFSQAFTPAYPTNPESPLLESDYSGRTVREIDFLTHPNCLKLGPFDAVDYFGDGSLYLLSTPGHAVGHMCALARTTLGTFILAGGDVVHHGGELRPSEYVPLPERITPSPFSNPPFRPGTFYPGALVETTAHPKYSSTEPFYEVTKLGFPDFHRETAKKSTRQLGQFDGNDDIFIVIAHDASLEDVIDFFPKKAKAWKEKGWKSIGLWKFLEDFAGAIKVLMHPKNYRDMALLASPNILSVVAIKPTCQNDNLRRSILQSSSTKASNTSDNAFGHGYGGLVSSVAGVMRQPGAAREEPHSG